MKKKEPIRINSSDKSEDKATNDRYGSGVKQEERYINDILLNKNVDFMLGYFAGKGENNEIILQQEDKIKHLEYDKRKNDDKVKQGQCNQIKNEDSQLLDSKETVKDNGDLKSEGQKQILKEKK